MVSLLVTAPAESAPYLTSQLYATNYHLRHRMDILESLAQAAQELAQVDHSRQQEKQNLITPLEPEHWKTVVQQRIEKKTRRFGKGRPTAAAAESKNRFAPVASLFFFPLLSQYDT
jgi:telomere length regulation protein